ncbi:unnamed protein product [Amoebophrya sp. A120]|nr:unnamed protein product [Amoebophrya sp. A120]|eukprot:GSA120T00005842001.1
MSQDLPAARPGGREDIITGRNGNCQKFQEAIRAMPKVELHAHLSGSVSQTKLQEMLAKRVEKENLDARTRGGERTPDGEIDTLSQKRPTRGASTTTSTFEKFDVRSIIFGGNKTTSPDAAPVSTSAPKSSEAASSASSREQLLYNEAMKKCFSYFDLVAQVITDLDALREATTHVFEEFADEGCVYLEMRTTPKKFTQPAGHQKPHTGPAGSASCSRNMTIKSSTSSSIIPTTSEEDYICVVKECADEIFRKKNLVVKLLLSINRGTIRSKQDAEDQVAMVSRLLDRFFYDQDGSSEGRQDHVQAGQEHDDRDLHAVSGPFVVGLDVSGNPATDSVVPFLLPVLVEKYRELEKMGKPKPPIAWHLGEREDHCVILPPGGPRTATMNKNRKMGEGGGKHGKSSSPPRRTETPVVEASTSDVSAAVAVPGHGHLSTTTTTTTSRTTNVLTGTGVVHDGGDHDVPEHDQEPPERKRRKEVLVSSRSSGRCAEVVVDELQLLSSSSTPAAEVEVDKVLDHVDVLNIRRLGHVCFLTAEQRRRVFAIADRRTANELPFCVELCPTSNAVTKCLRNLADHHFPLWYAGSSCKRKINGGEGGAMSTSSSGEVAALPDKNAPSDEVASASAPPSQLRVALCTDDTGLFCCTISSELEDMAVAFRLSLAELRQLQLDAIDASFLVRGGPPPGNHAKGGCREATSVIAGGASATTPVSAGETSRQLTWSGFFCGSCHKDNSKHRGESVA